MCIVRRERRSDKREMERDIPMNPEYPTTVIMSGK
jgi:hypothetical protein